MTQDLTSFHGFDMAKEEVEVLIQLEDTYSKEFTLVNEAMGFDANGVLTCQGWGLNKQPMTDGVIAMHRTITFIPPAD